MPTIPIWLASNLVTIILLCVGGFALHSASTKGTVDALKDSVAAWKTLNEATEKKLLKIEEEQKQQSAENVVRDFRIETLEEEVRIRDRKINFKDSEVRDLEEIITITATDLKPVTKSKFDEAMANLDKKRSEFNRTESMQSDRRKLFHPLLKVSA